MKKKIGMFAKEQKMRRKASDFLRRYKMAEIKANEFVDITDVNCPVTFVKTKVALEEIEVGEILQVHLNDGEPVQNVPRSLKDEGHKVLKLEDNGDGTFELYVEKGEE